jgi:hypothetical protein
MLGLPAVQHALAVMGLDPTLEESGGHRKPRDFVVDRFKIHAGKPARENVFSNLGSQAAFDPRPALLIRICHFVISCGRHGREGVTTEAQAAVASRRNIIL